MTIFVITIPSLQLQDHYIFFLIIIIDYFYINITNLFQKIIKYSYIKKGWYVTLR